jgi:transcriptional regulator with PAS, ATPase and Fis domain
VGDISSELQTKLLRFIQEREFERVGGVKPIGVDVRIIAATNRNLETFVKEGRFREDLYHRLNVVPIALPPLRERREDISVLSQYFLRRFSGETKKEFAEIASEVQEKLLAYDWPGNARELANVIERAVVLGQGPTIELKDLPPRVTGAEPGLTSGPLTYRAALDASRRRLIVEALNQHQGNRAAAARALGLHEKYLLRVIKSLRID